LVVGAGPAGLEAARALGQRGYDVVLAEAATELGGRVAHECRLPGLSAWGRVRDYRATQIATMANVELYLDSRLSADHVRDTDCSLVAIATGSTWRSDGMGRQHNSPVPGSDGANVFTPDHIMAGTVPDSPVVIFDDDHYYMGGVLAEQLRKAGCEVTLVTPAPLVSAWTGGTTEQGLIQGRLIELGVSITALHDLAAIGDGSVDTACVYTNRITTRDCASVVMVTSREPRDSLYYELAGNPEALEKAGIRRVVRAGDCYAPGTIAAAVYAGHRFARELGAPTADLVPFKREFMAFAAAD
jgi:dimethylamine/trimethylamine dehydrogenase